MSYKKPVLILYITVCFLFIYSPSAFSAIKKQGKAVFWENIFLDQIKNFKYYSKEIDYLVYEIENDLVTFEKLGKDFNTRYHQLRFIMGTTINNPYEYRLIISELTIADRAFQERYQELKDLNVRAATSLKALVEMEDDLNSLSRQKFSNTKMMAASVRLVFNIRILKAQLNFEMKKIQNFLVEMKELDKFTNLSDFLDESFTKQLRSYFLEPGPAIWTAELTKLLPYSIQSWVSSLPTILKEKFPDALNEYLAVLFIFVIALIIYTLFHYLLIKKINIKARIPNAYELLLRALAALLIFIGLFATSSILIFPETVLFYRLGVVIFGFFAWFFSLALKMIQNPDAKPNSTLSTLFVIFSFGVLFQIFGVNYIMLSLLWPIVLVLAIFYQIIINHKNNNINKNGYFWFFIVLSLLFIFISFKGYIYLSIFCCMIWFLLSVILRIGTAFTWLLRAALDKGKHKEHFIRVVLLGLGIPSIWLFLFLIVYYWASMQISSNSFTVLEYITELRYNISDINIKVIDTLILIFLFFIFRTTIKAFIDYLSYSSYANKSQRHQVLPSMKSLTKYTGWIIYIIIAMVMLKVNITSILVVLGGLSVGIGFGLQHLVNNFLAGLIVMFGKACRPGDIIELDSKWASVLKTDIRTTTVRTFDNCIITVPNSILIDKELYNWTKNNDLIRSSMSIGVAYGSDVELVKKLLLEIAGSFDEVCKSPQPQVLFNDFGTNALIFKLRIWLHEIDNIVATPSAIRFIINQRFNEHNIKIAYPQMDLHIKEQPNNNSIETVLKGTK